MGFFVSRHLGQLLCNIAIMKRFLPLFILSSFLFGQDLYFKNNNNEVWINGSLSTENETIKIETGEKLHINDNKYTLLSTDYSKQYLLVKKHNSQIQDTLSFDSVVSFKYYEKSIWSLTSSVLKGSKYGVLIGAVVGLPEGINYGFHWVLAGSALFGGFGAFSGAVYGILIPRVSEEIILEKEGLYISN